MHKTETTFNITLEVRFSELTIKLEQDLTVLTDIGMRLSAPPRQTGFSEAQARITQLAHIRERTGASVEVKLHQIQVIHVRESGIMFHYHAFTFLY